MFSFVPQDRQVGKTRVELSKYSGHASKYLWPGPEKATQRPQALYVLLQETIATKIFPRTRRRISKYATSSVPSLVSSCQNPPLSRGSVALPPWLAKTSALAEVRLIINLGKWRDYIKYTPISIH